MLDELLYKYSLMLISFLWYRFFFFFSFATFTKLHTFSRSWFQSLISGRWEWRLAVLTTHQGKFPFGSRGKRVRRWATCPLGDSGKSGDPVKWYHTSKEWKQEERSSRSNESTSSCGFARTQKLFVFRSVKGRTFKSNTRVHAHTHTYSSTDSSFPTEVWLRCGRQSEEGDERRFTDRVNTFHISSGSICRERERSGHAAFRRNLKLNMLGFFLTFQETFFICFEGKKTLKPFWCKEKNFFGAS